MQKPQIALLFVIPADQQASRAIEPTIRALHDPALCRETGLLLERFGLFPPRAEVGGEAKFGQQLSHLVIALVQTHPQWVPRDRLRPCHGETLDGLPSHPVIIAIRALHSEAERHVTTVGEHAAS
jgi:hypothetical protein